VGVGSCAHNRSIDRERERELNSMGVACFFQRFSCCVCFQERSSFGLELYLNAVFV
jgi:hypothetical protein